MKHLILIAFFAFPMLSMSCASVSEADQKKLKELQATVDVLKATEDLEVGTALDESVVEVVQVPTAYLPPSPLLAGDIDDWVGQEVQLKVEAGRLLEGRDFMPPGGFEGFSPPRDPSVVSLAEVERKVSKSGQTHATPLAMGEEAYVGILEIQAGASVPAHQDPTEEFILVLEGEGVMTIDGEEYAVTADTFVYMPAEAEVSFVATTDVKAVQVFGGPAPAEKYDEWATEAADATEATE